MTCGPAINEKPIPLGGAYVSIAVAAIGDEDCRPLLLAATVVEAESATAALALCCALELLLLLLLLLLFP